MGSLPDQVYLDEIPKLRAYPNIRTLGYVATNYANKELQSVLAEVDTYAKWPKVTNDTKMRVDVSRNDTCKRTTWRADDNKGIFFDETPSTYSPGEYEYLNTASQAVRNGTSFKDRFVGTSFSCHQHDLLIVHNSP